MSTRRRLRLVALVATMALVASGCEYWAQAFHAKEDGTPVPWFCNPVAPNSVTGPGMGSVNWYAGMTRAPLDYDTCETIAVGLDEAKTYAEQYPTLGDAVDDGFAAGFDFISGMGTHHGKGGITPAMLADPDFDRDNPILPGGNIDDVFDPAEPEYLQFNGNGRDAVLVGMSYYVRTDTGLPPEGFPGDNDWWHHHPTLCLNPATATAFQAATSDATCSAAGGINVKMDDYYMLHVWLVDDLEYHGDVHAPMHPCIKSNGAIFDMDDPCHGAWNNGLAAQGAHAGHADHSSDGFLAG